MSPLSDISKVVRIGRSTAFVMCAGLCLSACARHPFEVSTSDGALLFSGAQSTCFVGCDLRIKTAQQERCRGHTPGIERETLFGAQIYCPGKPTQVLHVPASPHPQKTDATLDGSPVIFTFK
ncbi:MAG: hypothetical protein HRU30_10175 [Rhodobacteraceae bacterium]|nr:hypothetical protein [Paracoccaceae bacterium]